MALVNETKQESINTKWRCAYQSAAVEPATTWQRLRKYISAHFFNNLCKDKLLVITKTLLYTTKYKGHANNLTTLTIQD